MNFEYSEEQQLIQDSVARFVREEYGFDARRRIVESEPGFSAAHWALFAELGWLAVPIPEADGGLGGGVVECAILFEQFGRGLVVEPFLASTVLGGGIIAALGNESQRAELLARLVAGELQLALAASEPQARFELGNIACRATAQGDAWTLDGSKCVVLNAPAAEWLLVTARDAPARRLGNGGDALPALERVIERATLCVCAEAVGAMSALLEKTVAYTKVRKQFGVPIASFQALQHRMAEMFIELEQARSILLMALLRFDGEDDVARAVSAAKARIGRAARHVGQEAIQLHGGIGVTEELDVGHYVKRLVAIEALFGNSEWHLQRFGARNG